MEKKYVAVNGPNRSTICGEKYAELLIRVMCLVTGDDQSEYTSTVIPQPNVI